MLSSFKSKIGNVYCPIHLWGFSNGVWDASKHGDPQKRVLNWSGPYFTWYIWTHALEITDWHRHRRHFEFWFWPNEKVTRIFKSALYSNKAISEINQWIQVNNFYIHIMISIFTFYPKYVHAVSDYKKRSYKTQRWILGKI